MKSLFVIACSLACLLSPALAVTQIPSGIEACSVDNGVLTCSGPPEDRCPTGAIEIETGVTTIGDQAFRFCTSLTSVVIPEGVTTIGKEAFEYSSSLTSVEFPASLTTIGDYAFNSCPSLTSVDLSQTVVETIGITAFGGSSSLTSVEFPANLRTIEYGAFSGSGLTSVDLSHTKVDTIGGYAFYGTSLTSVEFPSTLTTINPNAFAYSSVNSITYHVAPGGSPPADRPPCSGTCEEIVVCPADEMFIGDRCDPCSVDSDGVLTCSKCPSGQYVILEGVTTIGDQAFQQCTSLTSVVIPEGVTTIGDQAFQHCTNLTSVEFPASLTTIEYGAFSGSNVISVDLSHTKVDTIGGNAFGFLSLTLTSVKFPSTLTTINPNAFDSSSVNSITYNVSSSGGSPPVDRPPCSGTCEEIVVCPADESFIGDRCDPCSVDSDGVLTCSKCPSGQYVIPEDAKTIGNYAFKDCTSLTSVDLSHTKVETIGEDAFNGCSSLTSVEFPEGVTTIGGYAFRYCSSLSSLEFPANLTTIEYGAFSGSGLTSVDLSHTKVDTIGSGAFYNCTSLTSVDLSHTKVETIGEYAFSECSSLTSVEFPASLTTIGDYAFQQCTSLTSVEFPASLTTIGSGAFAYSGLQSVDLSHTNVDTIGKKAFAISNVAEVKLSHTNVTTIGDLAFYNCTSLTSVDLSHTKVETIGKYAFSECSSLTSVEFPASLTTIESYAFKDCTNLTSVEFPASLTTIGSGAFETLNVDSFTYHVASSGGSPPADRPSCSDTCKEIVVCPAGERFIDESCKKPCSVDSDGVLTCSGPAEDRCPNGHYVIPADVTTIGGYAFRYCSSLTSVEFPASLTTIRDNAFARSNVAEVKLSHTNVTTIGDLAFYDCTNLTSVKFPSTLHTINPNAFDSSSVNSITYHVAPGGSPPVDRPPCSGTCEEIVVCPADEMFIDDRCVPCSVNNGVLTCSGPAEDRCPSGDYVIPEGVTTIGDNAFADCTNLTSVVIPADVTHILSYAFSGCSLTSVDLSHTKVETIGGYAFYGTSLTSVEFPSTLHTINPNAFDSSSVNSITYHVAPGSSPPVDRPLCSGTCEEIVVCPADEMFIDDRCVPCSVNNGVLTCSGPAEDRCPSGDYVIPEGVTTIGDNAFADCTNLTSVVIPASLTRIENDAFSGCSSLTSVNLSQTVVETIGDRAFYECTSLTSVEFPSTLTTIDSTAFDSSSVNSITYHVAPGGSPPVDRPSCSDPCEEIVVCPADEMFIGDRCDPCSVDSDGVLTCSKCPSGQYVILEGVTTIGDQAFQQCTSLTSVVIPEGVKNIGRTAFLLCTNLTSVEFPASLTTIEYGAFARSNVAEVKLSHTNVTTIEEHAFIQCFSLTSVEFPARLTTIEDSTFSKCTSLTSVVIPEGMTTIGFSAFSQCTNLISVEFPANLTTFGDGAFKGCTSLISVELSHTKVTTIGDSAFSGCTSLSSVGFPSKLTAISRDAFSKTNVTEVNLSHTKVETIGQAFRFYYNTQVETIGGTLRSLIRNIPVSVVFPSTLNTIHSDAFYETNVASITYHVAPGGRLPVPRPSCSAPCTEIVVCSRRSIYIDEECKLLLEEATPSELKEAYKATECI